MNVQLIPVESVVIPSGRFRPTDANAVESLAVSLLKFGQLQPIVIDQIDGTTTLIAGLHRLEAARANGWPTIAAVMRSDLNELERREMELEENIRRKQMTWLEEQQAIAEIHEIRVARDPHWGQPQTQHLVGAARQADVSEATLITKMVKLFPEIGKAKSKHQALSWAQAKARSVLRVSDVRDSHVDYSAIEQKIVLGDSVEVIKTIPDGSFNAIITDPPFGIDYDARKTALVGSVTSYEDSEGSYERLLSMAPDLYRVLREHGWLVWFLGVSWYERAKLAFRSAGFIVDEIPIVWDRSDGRSFTARPDRYFARAYDIALHCIKGDPQVIQRGKPNIIKVPPVGDSEREYLAERPVELYEELIRRLTVPREVVADFFVGSGSCPAAAAKLGRDYFGVELDIERRAYAIKKIKAYTPGA